MSTINSARSVCLVGARRPRTIIHPSRFAAGWRGWARRFATAGAVALAVLAATACGALASSRPGSEGRRTDLQSTGAVASQSASVGQAVTLNAGAALTSEPGDWLAYRWALISRPPRSHASVHGRFGAHATLRPDRPGNYVVRITIARIRARTAAGRSGRGRSLCADGCVTRRITVKATPPGGSIGVAVNTIWYGPGGFGVQVGAQGAPNANFYVAPNPSDALQLVALDRSSLTMVDNASFSNDATGASALLAAVKGLPNSDEVIITKPDPDITNATDPSAATTINQALAAIGAGPVAATVATGNTPWSTAGNCSAFSAIGVPGLPAGQGYVNPCRTALTSSGTLGGDLQGYFRTDLTGTHVTFVDDERVPFDTGDPNADPAVVTVGSDEAGSPVAKQTYTSENTDGEPGFFVVVLNAGTLAPLAQHTFVDDNVQVNGLEAMATMLSGWSTDPDALIIVRSIGKVGRVGPVLGQTSQWDQVAGDLEQFGGSKYYFDALSGSDAGYAQVGPGGTAGYPSPYTQVASSERSGSGRLTGLLALNSSSQFYPSESYPTDLKDASRPLAGTIEGIVSLPQSAWPDRDTPGDQNVLGCIAAHMPGATGALRDSDRVQLHQPEPHRRLGRMGLADHHPELLRDADERERLRPVHAGRLHQRHHPAGQGMDRRPRSVEPDQQLRGRTDHRWRCGSDLGDRGHDQQGSEPELEAGQCGPDGDQQ